MHDYDDDGDDVDTDRAGRLGTCLRFPQRPCVSRRPPGNLAKSTHGIMEIGPRIFFNIVCSIVLSTMLYMTILSCMCYISAVIKTQYLVKAYHTCLLAILQFFLPNKPVAICILLPVQIPA